jgi:hypothetical protein
MRHFTYKYLLLVLILFLASCSSETENIPWEFYMGIKQNDDGQVEKVTLGGLTYEKQ